MFDDALGVSAAARNVTVSTLLVAYMGFDAIGLSSDVCFLARSGLS